MSNFVINKPTIVYENGRTRVLYNFVAGEQAIEFYFDYPDGFVNEHGSEDAALTLGLMIAMKLKMPIETRFSVSSVLLKNIEKIQDIWLRWWADKYERVQINTTGSRDEIILTSGNEHASSFTGGVDSFYTLLNKKDSLDLLYYVFGYDVSIEDQAFSDKVKSLLRSTTGNFNQEFVEIITNLRTVTDKYVDWLDYHGAALAAVGMMLSSRVKVLSIPSTRTYDDATPMGSHPLTDRLWSTEYIDIDNEGAGVTRVQKIGYIKDSKAVQSVLRVCWRSKDDINCGVCEKCIRTMIALECMGVLPMVKTFPDKVKDEQLNYPIQPHYYPYIKDIYDWIERNGDLSEGGRIKTALSRLIQDYNDSSGSLQAGNITIDRLKSELKKLSSRELMSVVKDTVQYKINNRISMRSSEGK